MSNAIDFDALVDQESNRVYTPNDFALIKEFCEVVNPIHDGAILIARWVTKKKQGSIIIPDDARSNANNLVTCGTVLAAKDRIEYSDGTSMENPVKVGQVLSFHRYDIVTAFPEFPVIQIVNHNGKLFTVPRESALKFYTNVQEPFDVSKVL